MLHKHIARHTKKYVKHITKYLYERDTLFATIAVFLFLILLGMIPINFYVLNPMKLALKDFDFNDVAYAKLGKGKDLPPDRRITVINIGQLDREGIAALIEKVSSYNPKVMGLDVYFEEEREPEKDSILRSVFAKTKNLVVVSREAYDEVKHKFFILPDYFDSAYHLRGYANVDADTVGTVRVYSPFDEIEGKRYPHFTSALVQQYNDTVYKKLEERHKKNEIINYSRRTGQYWLVEPDELFQESDSSKRMKYLIENKIILFGYVNTSADDIEDKKFTPMNNNFAGKVKPDMNGVIVHANILSMVLDGKFIKKMPKWSAWLVAIVIGWIHMSLFIRYYLESHIWFHLVAKLAQVFSVLFFAYLGIFLFDQFRVKLDMKYTLYVVALAVDVIYFYEAFVTWLHRKYGYQTIFSHHHHPLENENKHGHHTEHNQDEHQKHETTQHEHY
jgi:CHASE2 domain-containing sensor protein